VAALGKPAPSFELQDTNGRIWKLADLRGQVVFVNFWATWCPPCREEMPSMDRLYRELGGEAFELLAVSQDDQGRAAVDAFVKEVPVSFPVLLDPERRVGSAYGVWGYPETFVIDREGRIVERVIGPREWDTAEQKQQLRALMATGAPAGAG
jgi:peroxiredoxin